MGDFSSYRYASFREALLSPSYIAPVAGPRCEQIAMMKPKGSAPGEEGMLEYLEDIIGSNA